jgi:hypothetical protein
MKVKDLIKELQAFNPDGEVTVQTNGLFGTIDDDCKLIGVEDNGCALINPILIAGK